MRPDPNKPTHQKDDGNGRNKRVYKQKPPERGFLREQLISANNLLKAARDWCRNLSYLSLLFLNILAF